MTISPAQAAATAKQWRKAAREPGLDPAEVLARVEKAARFQSLAACGIHGRRVHAEEDAA